MTTNEIRGELVTMLAYIHETEKLEKLRAFMQGLIPAKSQMQDGLTKEQSDILHAVYEQSMDETAFVSQEEAHKLFGQWRGQ